MDAQQEHHQAMVVLSSWEWCGGGWWLVFTYLQSAAAVAIRHG